MSQYIPQDKYDYILTHMPIACVDVCIVSEKGILLVKRNTEPAKGTWWVPGGRVHKGETLRDCAYRKCLEEVNLHCSIGPIVHTDETVFDTGPSGIPIHSINVCFLAIPHTADVKLDDYSDSHAWVPHIADNFHPYVRKCFEGCGFK